MSGSSRAACSEFPLGCVRTVLGRRYQLEMTATAQSEGTRCKVNAMAVVGVGKLACVPASRARRGWRQEQEFLRASCYEQIGRSRTGRGTSCALTTLSPRSFGVSTRLEPSAFVQL